jgi:hypothetical protein
VVSRLISLAVEHRRKVAVRADTSLSWEQKERRIRELGLKFDKDRKQLESEEAA